MDKPRLKAYVYPSPEGWSLAAPGGLTVSAADRGKLEAVLVKDYAFTEEAAKDFVDAKMCARHPSLCDNMPGSKGAGLPLGDLASLFLINLSEREAVQVPEEEAKRRLAVCHMCPHNKGLQAPGCCGTPKKLEQLAAGVAKELGVQKAFAAGWCGTLGYNLSIAAHAAPGNSISPIDCSYDSLPTDCPYRGRPDGSGL